jgi:LMBR1 domain-containing protein 1
MAMVFLSAVVAIKGNFLLGLNFLVVSLYPIRVGATYMSSFLINTALILAMSTAVIQFCANAFAAYASSTQIFDVFGNQVSGLGDTYTKVS